METVQHGEGAEQRRLPFTSASGRLAALLEVLLVFGMAHLFWRSFKHFTWLGHIESSAHQNYSAGMVMIIFTTLAVRLRGWNFSDFGLNLKDWRYNLNLGIFFGVISPVLVLFVIWLSGFQAKDMVRPAIPWVPATAGSVIAVAYSAILVLMLRKRRAAFDAVSPVLSISIFLALCLLPILSACLSHRSALSMAGTVGWMVIGAGGGEEIFFRGYVQTRLDLAFGYPFRFGDFQFGAGLIVSSLLFGLVHVLNTVDYFRGQFHFNWASGLFTCCAGVCYAVLRARSGSVFPGAVAHALGDVLGRIPG